jgi:hypothetical protein
VRIVVAHVTQMGKKHVCVAGIDEARVHVRPQTHAGGALDPDVLLENGGRFALGLAVDLGAGVLRPSPPHVEDFVCDPYNAEVLRPLPPTEFWSLIREVSQPSLRDIFGDDLYRWHGSCVTDYGKGAASLGFLRPKGAELLLDQVNGPRVSLSDGAFEPNVALNDLRFGTLPPAAVAGFLDATNRRIRADEELILGVGLTRFWDKYGFHFLQVTGVFLRDSPLNLAGPEDC